MRLLFADTARFFKSSTEASSTAVGVVSLSTTALSGGCLEVEPVRKTFLRFDVVERSGVSTCSDCTGCSAGSQPSEPFGCSMTMS